MGLDVPFDVVYRRVKYARLEFRGLRLLVILPLNVKDSSKVLERGRVWIERQWRVVQEAVKEVDGNDVFMIFGEKYIVDCSSTKSSGVSIADKRIYLGCGDPKVCLKISRQLKWLLKLKVESIIGDYSLRFGFKPNRVLIWRQKTKWGSCSSKGNITLNLKLVCLPEHMVKYVVFHELTHLKFKGHNRKFWQTVGMEFPNYKELERELYKYWFITEILFQNLTRNAQQSSNHEGPLKWNL